jgi:hypothetical protein
MITTERATELAIEWLQLQQTLKTQFGSDFEFAITLYEFDSHPNPEILAAITRYQRLRFGLRDYLHDKTILTKVSNPQACRAFELLAAETAAEAQDENAFDENQLNKLAEKLFYSRTSPWDFAHTYLQTRPLVTSTELPDRIHRLIEEARTCYALKLHHAVMALGRMILETALIDIGVRSGHFSTMKGLQEHYANYPPSERADRLFGKSSPAREEFGTLYDEGSRSIHPSHSPESPDAIGYLTRVTRFVSSQYAIFRHTFRD